MNSRAAESLFFLRSEAVTPMAATIRNLCQEVKSSHGSFSSTLKPPQMDRADCILSGSLICINQKVTVTLPVWIFNLQFSALDLISYNCLY